MDSPPQKKRNKGHCPAISPPFPRGVGHLSPKRVCTRPKTGFGGLPENRIFWPILTSGNPPNLFLTYVDFLGIWPLFRRTQEGCGVLRGENPAAFPQARPIFQQPFFLPESAQTLAGIACRAAGKSVRNFPAVPKFARKLRGLQ